VLGVDLESPTQLIERLKFPTFYKTDQLKACDIEANSSGVALAKRINPSVLKGTNILQVTYKAHNSALAVQCLDAIIDRVVHSQNKLSETALQNARKQLALTQGQLAESERIQSMLEKRSVSSLDAADTKFSQTVLLLSTTLSKKEEIQRLRKSVLDQMAALEPPATQSAHLIEPIYASEPAVFPKKTPALAGGLFGGLVLGGLVFFVRRSWLARRA
jgi:hypothetical protein